MGISEKKNFERIKFKKLRNRSSFLERRNVENNVKKYVESFQKKNKKIDHIAIYLPLKNEVDITSLRNNFQVALPRCTKNQKLLFYSWDDKPLTKDLEGILSPESSSFLSYEKISLIFIPCLSIDKSLVRLGYGGGYFDKLRSNKNWRNVPCIGLLTSNCVSPISLTKANWDIPLTGYITEKEIFV